MNFTRPFVWLGLLVLGAGSALADGGVVIARSEVNGYDVTVFASPSPVRVGPVDVSLLIQEAGTTRTVLDAVVRVGWKGSTGASSEWMPPCCTMDPGASLTAVRSHSQNKLLYSAIVPVRSSGPSEFLIQAEIGGRKIELNCPVAAAPPAPPAVAYWPFLVLPPFAIAGFVLHQRLKSRIDVVRSREQNTNL